MKRVFNYMAAFVAGILLGEVGIKSIFKKVMKEITLLKMDSVIDVFSSREIASGIWIIVFSLIFLSKPKVRKSLLKVVQAATVKKNNYSGSCYSPLHSNFDYCSFMVYVLGMEVHERYCILGDVCWNPYKFRGYKH